MYYHRDTLEVFLDKVNKVFPDYNYDKVEYTLSSSKIKVECKKHGIFEITPNNLIQDMDVLNVKHLKEN